MYLLVKAIWRQSVPSRQRIQVGRRKERGLSLIDDLACHVVTDLGLADWEGAQHTITAGNR